MITTFLLIALSGVPPIAQEIGIDEHLGASVPRELMFRDSESHRVRLGDHFDGKRPVVLVLAYYRCKMLCGLVLRGLAEALRQVELAPGDDYRLLSVSIDPADRPDTATGARAATLEILDREAQWPFLLGDAASIAALAESVGFRFRYDRKSDQIAHPAVVFVLTPGGRISRYLYGATFAPRDVRLALLEAGQGRTGSLFSRLLLACYTYDPAKRRYGLFVQGFLQVGAGVIFAALALLLYRLWRREQGR